MIKNKGNNINKVEDVDTITQGREEIKKENPKGAMQNMKVGKNKNGLNK
jgi:hypothetical protein